LEREVKLDPFWGIKINMNNLWLTWFDQ